MSSDISAIRDLKKGTGSDRGDLTKKRSKALCQKVVFLLSFCNRQGYTSVWPGRFDGHVWRVCAKHGDIPQNYGREKLEKNIFALGRAKSHSVLSFRVLNKKNGILSVIGFKFFTKSALQKHTQNMLIEQSRGGILMESIALDTAAGQKCVESASRS